MSSRMVKEFSQEVKDFERQMGCMAGVFRIFDRRRHLLTGGQDDRGSGTGNALPPGHALQGRGMNAPVQKSANPNITMEKSFSKSMTESSSLSTESSRASSSSSSCSSFSSLDGRKTVQHELPYINEETVMGRTLRSSRSLKSSDMDVKSKQPNTDFRDVMKDSINRDSYGLAHC